MSHLPERAEKKCLNCHTEPLTDRYCPHCGQDNVEPKQSLWHLFVHFFNDFWHFDGSFFKTIKLLLLRPGFLSKEYVSGKRKKYLDPIRLYIFISAAALLYLLSVVKFAEYVNIKQHPEFVRAVDSLRAVHYGESIVIDVPEVYGQEVLLLNVPENMRDGLDHYKSTGGLNGDNAVQNFLAPRLINMYDAYDANPYNFLPAAIDKFLHSFSKIFFISLPFFILFLYLLYLKKRKQFLLYDHAIFSLHYYCFGFILVAFLITVSDRFENFSFDNALDNVLMVLWLTGLYFYLFAAMRRFYSESIKKTIVKSIFLFILSSSLITVVMAVFFLNSFLSAY